MEKEGGDGVEEEGEGGEGVSPMPHLYKHQIMPRKGRLK
jgi:hypothetical protein